MIYLVLQKQCQWKLVVKHIYQTSDMNDEIQESIEYLQKLYFPTEVKFVDGPSSTLIVGKDAHTFIIDNDGDIKEYMGLEMFNLRAWRMAISDYERRLIEQPQTWYSSVLKGGLIIKEEDEKKKRCPKENLTFSDRYLVGRINGDVTYPSGNKVLARVRHKDDRAIAEPIEPNYAAWEFDKKFLSPSIDLVAVGAIPLRHGPKGSPNPPNLERIRAFN